MDTIVTIEYCTEGQSMPDFDFTDFVIMVKRTLAANEYHEFKVSNAVPVLAVLTEIAEGWIDYKRIVFKYYDLVFQANEYGAIQRWPTGWCNLEADFAERRLRAQVKKHKHA